MDNEKFYAPDITEFYVGFQYEFLVNHGSPYEKWEPRTIEYISDTEDDPYKGYTLNSLEKYNNVFIRNAWRVKYLDKEDIESLGWKLYEESGLYLMSNRGYVYMLTRSHGQIIIQMELTVGAETTNTDGTIFRGTIKNKSELKQLMKQLNIL